MTDLSFPSHFFFRKYLELVAKLKDSESFDEPTNLHHIYPVSIFGENEITIKVTIRHHIILHYLLYRGYQEAIGPDHASSQKMSNAMRGMSGLLFRVEDKCSKEKRDELQLLIERARSRAKQTPWNKGKILGPFPDEERIRKYATRVGRSPWNKGKVLGPVPESIKAARYEQMKARGTNKIWNKGIPWSEEVKAKMRKPKKEGSGANMSAAHVGKPWSEARRASFSKKTPEQQAIEKANRSAATKRRWERDHDLIVEQQAMGRAKNR